MLFRSCTFLRKIICHTPFFIVHSHIFIHKSKMLSVVFYPFNKFLFCCCFRRRKTFCLNCANLGVIIPPLLFSLHPFFLITIQLYCHIYLKYFLFLSNFYSEKFQSISKGYRPISKFLFSLFVAPIFFL